jgi:hypothetical protein
LLPVADRRNRASASRSASEKFKPALPIYKESVTRLTTRPDLCCVLLNKQGTQVRTWFHSMRPGATTSATARFPE